MNLSRSKETYDDGRNAEEEREGRARVGDLDGVRGEREPGPPVKDRLVRVDIFLKRCSTVLYCTGQLPGATKPFFFFFFLMS